MLRQGFVRAIERHGVTPHAEVCMAKIRAFLANPKPPGNWWAHEVLAKARAGHPYSLGAIELAEKALAGEGERIPGEDDE